MAASSSSSATPTEIYRRPVNRFVAGFVGSPAMNFVEGKLARANGSAALRLSTGEAVNLDGYDFAGHPEDGRTVVLGVRPEQMDLEAASGPSSLSIEVSLIDPMGADSLLWANVGADIVSVRIGPDDSYAPGERLQAYFQPGHASLFDAQSGDRI